MRQLQRRRPGGDPTDEAVLGPLPVRVQDARARAAAAVDGGHRAPDDAVGDGDEGIIYNHGWV
jgi:hypothetical protein